MVTGYEITEKMPENGMSSSGVLSSGGGVIDFSRNISDVRIGFGLKIALPFLREFPQVMPQSCQIAPIPGGVCFRGVRGKHFRSKLGGPEGDFIEMAMVGFEALAF